MPSITKTSEKTYALSEYLIPVSYPLEKAMHSGFASEEGTATLI